MFIGPWVQIPPPPHSPDEALAKLGFGRVSADAVRLSRSRPRAVLALAVAQGEFIMHYVYLLMCSDNKPYTYCTDNLKDRIICHQKGQVPTTKERLPIKPAAYFAFLNRYTAFNFEKYLKSGSGRAFLKKHKFIDFEMNT